MNSTQMDCLQKLVNILQECEDVGLTFSYASVLINVEDNESHYLETLSSEKLSKLLNFIDGCGVFKTNEPQLELENPQTPETYIGYDDGKVGFFSLCTEVVNEQVRKD